MSNYDRAAQFAPFAALKGYDEEIEEAIRTTENKIELSDEQISQLNEKLKELKEIIKEQPFIKVSYFVPDEKKSGGKYITTEQQLRKIDEYKRKLILSDREVEFSNILQIDCIK